MSLSLLDFLNHIISECEYILRMTSGRNRNDILGDETISKAIVRSLEVIGEATKKVPFEIKQKYPQIHWAEMSGMRDVLIHNYFGVDYDVVWNTILHDIPELNDELKRIVHLESKK